MHILNNPKGHPPGQNLVDGFPVFFYKATDPFRGIRQGFPILRHIDAVNATSPYRKKHAVPGLAEDPRPDDQGALAALLWLDAQIAGKAQIIRDLYVESIAVQIVNNIGSQRIHFLGAGKEIPVHRSNYRHPEQIVSRKQQEKYGEDPRCPFSRPIHGLTPLCPR